MINELNPNGWTLGELFFEGEFNTGGVFGPDSGRTGGSVSGAGV